MTILITGGAGFIGSAVVRAALLRKHKVVNIDCLTYAANLENLRSTVNDPNYSFEKANICDPEAMKYIFEKHQPSQIMHLAAESHVDRSIDSPDDFIQTNIFGTYNLLQTSCSYFQKLSDSRKTAFRFHHVSTDEVYGDLSPDEPAFSETTPYSPSSPYSASKASSDHLVRSWARTYGLPTLITNCSNNYGPFQFPEKLIPVVILKALSNTEIPVYGKGDNIRDWLYVDDHADALLCVLEKGTVGETYNIGGNNERTNLELVQTLCQLVDQKRPKSGPPRKSLIHFVKDRPGHDCRYAINANKIKQDLGWQPSIEWNHGFSLTLEWYLDNQWWWQPLVDKNKFGTRIGVATSSP